MFKNAAALAATALVNSDAFVGCLLIQINEASSILSFSMQFLGRAQISSPHRIAVNIEIPCSPFIESVVLDLS